MRAVSQSLRSEPEGKAVCYAPGVFRTVRAGHDVHPSGRSHSREVDVISKPTMVFAVIVVLLAFVLGLLHFTGGAPCVTGRQQLPGVEEQQASVPPEPCRPTMAEHELQAAVITFWVCVAGLVIAGGIDVARRTRA